MGYFVNLPPRYVHQIETNLPQHIANEEEESTTCSMEQQTHGVRRSVSFDESSTQTFLVPASDVDASWYSCEEILSFKTNWNTKKKLETETLLSGTENHVRGQRPTSLIEDLQTFASECNENRKILIKRILEHQTFCRSQGFYDPDGLCMLSKSITRYDRKTAHRTALANAFEVDGFQQEKSYVSIGSLLMDYYWQSIHPNMDDPLSYLTKVVLCQCD